MTRRLLFTVLLLASCFATGGTLPGPASGLLPAALAQGAPAAPARPAAAPAGEAERMLDILRNDNRRAELIRNLEALAAAERGARAQTVTPPAAAVTGAPATQAPNTSAAQSTSAQNTSAQNTPAQNTPAPGGTAPNAPGTAAPAGTPATGQAAEAPPPETPPVGTATPAAPATPATVAPSTLVSQLLASLSERLQHAAQQVTAGTRVLADLPTVASWASGVARDPVSRTRITDASWKLLVVFGAGILAEIAIFHLLHRPRRRLDTLAPEPGAKWSWLRRVPIVLGRVLLDLVPVLGFALVSYGLIEVVHPLPTTQLIMLTLNNAYILVRAIMIASRMLFSPASAHLRLIHMSDETAAYITVWLRRIVGLAVFGYGVAEAVLQFGVPWAVYDGIIRLVMLLVSLLLVIVILQNRRAVADLLRAPPLEDDETPGRGRRAGRALRNRLAEIWHVVAILWLLALWGVWALEVQDGFGRLLRGTAATLLILAVAKGLDYGMRRLVDRGFQVGPEFTHRYPGLEERANRYTPVLHGVLSFLITLVAGLVLLEAWGIGAFAWFTQGRLGARVIGALVSIGLTLAIAIAVWEVSNAAIARQLVKASREGQAARSARVRTLLPMMRTALMVVIVIFIVLNVLSEIGVNVAPLIAGASVVGVAIGFGSQTLVKDVVTGLFLLLEDAVAVGDTVTLGSPPQTGVVERLSIRSIRLRAVDGAVHIIPFSAVTSVTNMTRDFAFAMLEFSLPYGEDTDRVGRVLREIAKEMRGETRWGNAIRDDMDVMGVEKLAETGVVLRARLKTDPSQRAPVARELNRRIQARFEELGIFIPSPWRKPAEEAAAEDGGLQPAPATA